jgi:NAD(P)-dependent dehydrogenase (short-subunit alcohol dehydrogenase family)
METQQKVVIVTGASQGIGAGVVERFRTEGFSVLATSRSITPSEDPNVVTVAGDISVPETAKRVVATAIEHFGHIDTLVNNAGIFDAKPFTEWSVEEFDRALAVNIGGFFHVSQAAIAQMLERGSGGHVVNITTALVDQPDARVPAALASITKGGLNSVTKGLALEYASRGIRVNAVSPGLIKTPMHPESTHETYSSMHPIGRMGEISEIADAILFLDSVKFVTGEVLHVDGGQNAGH